ncbi:MAG: Crp/Fnr family transcriptional regulator [Actinomycetota bacterium]|nr:Crp/Fnr family transcriptional regulator [Actinomycetota bacterium]
MSSPPALYELARNRLLAALPQAEARRLASICESVDLQSKAVLYEAGETVEDVYFSTGAVVSLVHVAADGSVVEVATIGNEGMAGLPAFLGTGSSPGRAVTQIPGGALRAAAGAFRELADASGALHDRLQRYTQALLTQAAQNGVCHRLHSMEARCSRWILQTSDRAQSAEFPLTQEFLAEMMGVRRPSVTVAAGTLQQAGFIRYRRGRMAVVDREGLKAAACECYDVITEEYDRLLG